MSSLVADVIEQCGASLVPEDCANDVDGNCILQVTLDCFQQLISNAAMSGIDGIGQIGGGRGQKKPFSHDFSALVPYLSAYGTHKVDRSTVVPAGLVMDKARSRIPPNTPYWTEIQLGSVLRPAGIAALNRELAAYARSLMND